MKFIPKSKLLPYPRDHYKVGECVRYLHRRYTNEGIPFDMCLRVLVETGDDDDSITGAFHPRYTGAGYNNVQNCYGFGTVNLVPCPVHNKELA